MVLCCSISFGRKGELYRLDSMAGDGHHGHRGVDDWIAKEVQAELGLLVVPFEQRPLDCLGRRGRRLCANSTSVRVGGTEHKGRCEEPEVDF